MLAPGARHPGARAERAGASRRVMKISDPHPGRAPHVGRTPYGDCLEYLVIVGTADDVTIRLIVRSTPAGGLFARIERTRNTNSAKSDDR